MGMARHRPPNRHLRPRAIIGLRTWATLLLLGCVIVFDDLQISQSAQTYKPAFSSLKNGRISRGASSGAPNAQPLN